MAKRCSVNDNTELSGAKRNKIRNIIASWFLIYAGWPTESSSRMFSVLQRKTQKMLNK